jgi:hypothetical protein
VSSSEVHRAPEPIELRTIQPVVAMVSCLVVVVDEKAFVAAFLVVAVIHTLELIDQHRMTHLLKHHQPAAAAMIHMFESIAAHTIPLEMAAASAAVDRQVAAAAVDTHVAAVAAVDTQIAAAAAAAVDMQVAAVDTQVAAAASCC